MKCFESINLNKFEKLNNEELTKISGGKWVTERTTGHFKAVTCNDPDGKQCYEWVTSQHQQRYNIFGNPTGDWQIVPDC